MFGSLAGQRAELIDRIVYRTARRSRAKVSPLWESHLKVFSQPTALVGGGEDLAESQRTGVASASPSPEGHPAALAPGSEELRGT